MFSVIFLKSKHFAYNIKLKADFEDYTENLWKIFTDVRFISPW